LTHRVLRAATNISAGTMCDDLLYRRQQKQKTEILTPPVRKPSEQQAELCSP